MLPLQNRRILITRTRRQASVLAVQLEAMGATTIIVPTIEIVPPESYAVLDEALAQIRSFDWLLFTSANAVEAFAERLRLRADATVSLSKTKIAVIGPATARAIEALGLSVSLMPQRYVAESLVESLLPHAQGGRMLLVRAEEARDVLPEALSRAGATVTIAAAYKNQIPEASIPAVRKMFSSPTQWPDAITFTSASTVRHLETMLVASGARLSAEIAIASIGPVTSETLRELGMDPTVEAEAATIESLVQALVRHFEQKRYQE
jgi:uroporphyrinogen-III synthase